MHTFKKKIYMDRLFPPLVGDNYNKLQIDNESVAYITPYNLAVMTVGILMRHHADLKRMVVMDMTGGVGGDTIIVSSRVGYVVSVELMSERHMMLCNNLEVYGIKNAHPVCGNSVEIFEKLNFIDIVYIDPPWGGRAYKEQRSLRLMFDGMPIERLVCRIFDPHQLSRVKTCCMKLPLNYDIESLYRETKHLDVAHYLYRLDKMFIVIIQKNDNSMFLTDRTEYNY